MVMQYRAVVVAIWLAAGVSGQFRDLTTDRHGTRVLFSSKLSLKDAEVQEWAKLFEASAVAVRTFLVEDPGYPFPAYNPREPNYFRLRGPELSSNGLTLAYLGERFCGGGSGCVAYETMATTVMMSNGGRRAGNGRIRISANGRWGYNYGFNSFIGIPKESIIDLERNTMFVTALRPAAGQGVGGRMIANDGSAVIGTGNKLRVVRPGQPAQEFQANAAIGAAVIDDAARFAVYQTMTQPPFLWAMDLYTGEQTLLVAAWEGCSNPVLTEDGTSMLFLSAANWAARNDGVLTQAWVMDLLRGTLQQVTPGDENVTEATISGDGTVVFSLTTSGRLLRTDMLTGETTAMIASTPEVLVSQPFGIVTGEQVELGGSGLNEAVVRLNGDELTVVERSPTRIVIQVPATAATGDGVLEFEGPKSPYWPQRVKVIVDRPSSAE